MRMFIGTRTAHGCVVRLDGKPVDPRLDIWNESRTGPEWGGSDVGASQLAFELCSAVLGRSAEADERTCRVYQVIRETIVARLPHGSWRLTEAEVKAGILEAENEARIREAIRRCGTCGTVRAAQPHAAQTEDIRALRPSEAELEGQTPRAERAPEPQTKAKAKGVAKPAKRTADDDLLGPDPGGPYPRWWLPTYEAMVDLARRQAEWDRPWNPEAQWREQQWRRRHPIRAAWRALLRLLRCGQ